MPPQAPASTSAHTTIVFWVPLLILASFLVLVVGAYFYSVANPGVFISEKEATTAHIYYDRSTGTLVSDATVLMQDAASKYAATIVQTRPTDSTVVMKVPHESVIYDQARTGDGSVVYATLLTNAEYVFDQGWPRSTSTVSTANMIAFGYNVLGDGVFFVERVPPYNTFHAASPGGELIALRHSSCTDCDRGTTSYYLIDTTGNVKGYTDLGPLYDLTFTGARTYTATAASFEGCTESGCVMPGAVTEGSL